MVAQSPDYWITDTPGASGVVLAQEPVAALVGADTLETIPELIRPYVRPIAALLVILAMTSTVINMVRAWLR